MMGARWDAGVWHLSYRFQKTRDGGYMKMTASQGARQITANLYS